MGGIDRRLEELGIVIPEVTPPLAMYVPSVLTGEYVYTSGQLPFVNGELVATGRVGVDITPDEAAECARVCAINAIAAVKNVIGDLDRVIRIVKVVGFVASAPEFSGQPVVVNGASNLIGEVFGDAGIHARSAVGVASLPMNAPVEVELIAHVRA